MDSTAIIVGIISAAAMIIATLITAKATQTKLMQEIHTSNEVQNVKIDHLTDEVRRHNGFAEKLPHIEEQVNTLNREMKDVKSDIKNLQNERRAS